MKILLVSPISPGGRTGNTTTAQRWARLLRELGHRVEIHGDFAGQPGDLLLALHARRSASSIRHFASERPGHPIVLALTGTDLYGDIHNDPSAAGSLELAWRFVVLQRCGVRELGERFRDRTQVIYQSAVPPPSVPPPLRRHFEVCVSANLRPVKDPLRAAAAVRLLGPGSRVLVTHIGAAHDDGLEVAARRETATNPRYRWLGARQPREALRLLGRSRLMVLSSLAEGGANVVSEALSMGVPIVSSRIAGSVGMLGEDHPGYFKPGDTAGLADLLARAESDPAWLEDLRKRSEGLRSLVDPARERASWAELLSRL
ncbi:MAG: selenoneine biosynthesis selenosugar synthase SenB [Actinomycetota bacterium]